ncbi:hypothetical protein GCK32_004472 [Trichostrongylus colubriformis]|uniref:Uncharacterized protein n=1 Tax=Trichostrongylus colubriformis TaxID=6319 RepID=A0AAN8J1J6_TRICO
MPPSSWNSFAKINSSIPGLVLSPYQIKYEYLRCNSMLDRAQWNSTERSAVISQVVTAASALLRAATDFIQLDTDTKSKLKIEREFVSCFYIRDEMNGYRDANRYFSRYLDQHSNFKFLWI